jgi:uncharacterized protein (DUF952 family)
MNEGCPVVYKILPAAVWTEGQEFTGYGIDLNDGFIHLSSPTQVAGWYCKLMM